MLALRLPPDLEQRLEALARRTNRTKSYYAREAIERHLADLEDGYLALERRLKAGPRVGLDELEAEMDGEPAS